MDENKGFRIHSFILFVIIVFSGGYLAYIQKTGSDNLYLKLVLLFVFLAALYFGTRNWVADNPKKNKKNYSDPDKKDQSEQ